MFTVSGLLYQIKKVEQIDHGPIDSWTQNLWKTTKELLRVNSSIHKIIHLVVNIFQGSKRNLLGTISRQFMHKEDILKWGRENVINLKTKKFANECDLHFTYSNYYYKHILDKQRGER